MAETGVPSGSLVTWLRPAYEISGIVVHWLIVGLCVLMNFWGSIASTPSVVLCCSSLDSIRAFDVKWVVVRRLSVRPVLKHGPRSLTCMQVNGSKKPYGAMKVKGCFSDLRCDPVNSLVVLWAQHRPVHSYSYWSSDWYDMRAEQEHTCWDPKDGELCLLRLKPGETLVEDRSGFDVQIDRQKWA